MVNGLLYRDTHNNNNDIDRKPVRTTSALAEEKTPPTCRAPSKPRCRAEARYSESPAEIAQPNAPFANPWTVSVR